MTAFSYTNEVTSQSHSSKAIANRIYAGYVLAYDDDCEREKEEAFPNTPT